MEKCKYKICVYFTISSVQEFPCQKGKSALQIFSPKFLRRTLQIQRAPVLTQQEKDYSPKNVSQDPSFPVPLFSPISFLHFIFGIFSVPSSTPPVPTTPPAGECPTNWIKNGSACYEFVPHVVVAWDAAEYYCQVLVTLWTFVAIWELGDRNKSILKSATIP